MKIKYRNKKDDFMVFAQKITNVFNDLFTKIYVRFNYT